MTNKFIGDKLRLARLLNGMTLKELGEAVTASRQFIHQLEGDIRQPPEDMLYALCEALSVRKAFFYKELENDVKFEQCHFRKRKTTPVGLANRVCSYSTVFEELVGFLSEYVEFPTPDVPDLSNDAGTYTNLEMEEAAETCRKHWKLGLDNPIDNITNVLEHAGVVITSFSGVSEKVDALSLYRKRPIIIRNDAKKSPCRLRFDLAHECGHFALHSGTETGDTITESEANRFASAFIFPRSAFVKEFPRNFVVSRESSWRPIYDLKIRWGMSLKAIIYRAHFLKIISSQQYRAANVKLGKTGQSKNEWYDNQIETEIPELLTSSIELLNEAVGISFSKLADHLHITTEMLSVITGIVVPENENKNNVEPLFRR
jgi:Zn-dependent peptidase ImmA (M78 family)/transcriptional regulator with XRE-family HTH domain